MNKHPFFRFLALNLGMTALFYMLPVQSASAELLTLSGQGEYIMEDNETVGDAQNVAYREAMRYISQQAGVYIESVSQSENNQLTQDEIVALTETVVQVKEKRFERAITTDGKIKILAFLSASLDTDKADAMMKERVEAHRTETQYNKATSDYEQLKGERDNLKTQYEIAAEGGARGSIRHGDELMEQKKFAEAFACYDRAVNTAESFAEAYSKRGEALRMQNRDDEAMRDYEKALSLDEKDALGHYGRACILDKRGERRDAVKEYRLFMDYADIDFYDEEISKALDRIMKLDKS